jgi:hypothetical protein
MSQVSLRIIRIVFESLKSFILGWLKVFLSFFFGTYSIKCSYSLLVILCHSLLPFISTAISFDNSGHVQSLSVSLSLIDSQVKLAYLSMKFSAIIVISPQAVLKKEMGIFQRAFENLLRSYFLSLTCLIYSCSKSIFFLHNSYHQVHMIFYLHLFFVITMTTKY